MTNDTQTKKNVENLKKQIINLNLLVVIFGIILLANFFAVRGYNIWTGSMFIVISLLQMIVLVLMRKRVRSENNFQELGNAIIEYSWILLSISIGLIAILPSPFFSVPIPWFAVAALVSLGWIFISLYNMYLSKKKTGVSITI